MIQIKEAKIRITDNLVRVFLKVDGRTMGFDIPTDENIEVKFAREFYQVVTGRRKTAIVKPAKE